MDATPEGQEPHIEQLAQQQKPEPQPVRFVRMESILVPVLGGMRVYTTAIDDTGAIWERWSDSGKWHEVDRPTR